MDDQARLTAKIDHARQVERVVRRLGWATVALGIIGAVACLVFWATGDLSTERAIGILLGSRLRRSWPRRRASRARGQSRRPPTQASRPSR